MKTAVVILLIVAACQAHRGYYGYRRSYSNKGYSSNRASSYSHHWDARSGSHGYSSSSGNYYRYQGNSGLPFVPSKYRNNAPTARRIDSRIVQSIDEELATKFTIESCKYFESFDCDQSCDLCKLCDSRSGSQRPECSAQCANGIDKCKSSCKAGQDQCKLLTSRFAGSSGIIPMNTDFSQFSGIAELTAESCQYFENFNCKETCGLCSLCNTPRGRNQAECKTLCTLGIDTCTNVCEAGQQRCAGAAELVTTPAPKSVEVTQDVATEFTVDACKYFATVDCNESCGLCDLCGRPGYSGPECSSLCKGGKQKCMTSCKAGQEQCLIVTSRFTNAATSIIPMNTDFSGFSDLSELTVESCDYFSSFNCKESCGLCKLCDLVPGGSRRPECSTLCASGIDTCTSVCEAGQARCANAAQLATTIAPRTIAVTQDVANKFTVDSCKYFATFDCDESCGLCDLCGKPGFTSPAECSTLCASGKQQCKKSCKAGQEQCLIITSRFTDAATSIIPMNSDFSEFPALSELTVESCDYFSSFDCKETCGLCKLCDLIPGGSSRPECSTLCASGIDTCTSVCQAGQARCANAAQLATTPAPKAVPLSQEVATEFTIESCNYFSKFDCKETCGLCKFCNIPGFDKTRSECSTHCANGIDACTQTCNAGQAKCLEFISPISDLSASIDAGALTAASTIDSCQYFGNFNCKETCGLCNLCNLVPGGSNRPECSTLCNLGINKCNSVCEAGKTRCSVSNPTSSIDLRTPAVPAVSNDDQAIGAEVTVEACKYYASFDCEKTCGLCDLCTPSSTRAECSTLCKLGKEKCTKFCKSGQDRCLTFFANLF